MAQESVNLPLRYGETYTFQDCDDWREYLDLEEFKTDAKALRAEGWIPLEPKQATNMEKTFYDVEQKQPGMTPMLRIVYLLGHVNPKAIEAKRFVPANQYVPQNPPPKEKPKSYHPYTKECTNCKQYILMDWNAEEGFVARDIATHQRHQD